jgi:hypothetical protein
MYSGALARSKTPYVVSTVWPHLWSAPPAVVSSTREFDHVLTEHPTTSFSILAVPSLSKVCDATKDRTRLRHNDTSKGLSARVVDDFFFYGGFSSIQRFHILIIFESIPVTI